MLKRVGRLPKTKKDNRGESYVAPDVREFLRNTLYDVAEVAVEGRRPGNVVAMLRNYIKRHPEQCAGIGACMRGGRAYLYRKGVGQ